MFASKAADERLLVETRVQHIETCNVYDCYVCIFLTLIRIIPLQRRFLLFSFNPTSKDCKNTEASI